MILVCILRNHFFLGIRSSQLVVTFKPFMTIYNIWHTATQDKHDRIQLAFIIKTNSTPPPKKKRSFFNIRKYFESDTTDDSMTDDEETSFIKSKSMNKTDSTVYRAQRYLKLKGGNQRLSMSDHDIVARHSKFQRNMRSIENFINA